MRGLRSTIALVVVLAGLGAYIHFVTWKQPEAGASDSKQEKVFAALESDKIEEVKVKSDKGDTTTVRSVVADGPAEKAGLRVGDRLDRLGGVAVFHLDGVRRQLARARVGDELKVVLGRGGRAVTVVVTVGPTPAD